MDEPVGALAVASLRVIGACFDGPSSGERGEAVANLMVGMVVGTTVDTTVDRSVDRTVVGASGIAFWGRRRAPDAVGREAMVLAREESM